MALSLLGADDPQRPIAFDEGRIISVGEFAEDVHSVAELLPECDLLINLCEQRYRFMAAYCAALLRGQTNLLPSSAAPEAVAEVKAMRPRRTDCCDDAEIAAALGRKVPRTAMAIADEHIAHISFTSGTTGQPQPYPKRWSSLLRSTACNAERVREQVPAGLATQPVWIVSTVPPRHMYGMEMTVLLPLAAGMAIHSGRPLFPADVAAALAQVPEPRMLVTTPAHMRTLIASTVDFPPVQVCMSATAPLERELAAAVESRVGARMLEVFGATETCVFATRLAAHEEAWRPYAGVRVTSRPDSAVVEAPWFDAPKILQDVFQVLPDGRFRLQGRNVDLIEVAGKRASLSDLTRRLLAIPGVRDAVVFQPETATPGATGVHRIAALVVAPGLDSTEILNQLRDSIDPVFLPRPILIVPALPRNELGKLARRELLERFPEVRLDEPST